MLWLQGIFLLIACLFPSHNSNFNDVYVVAFPSILAKQVCDFLNYVPFFFQELNTYICVEN